MGNLKIEIFVDGALQPLTTVKIPISNLEFAKNLVPLEARSILEDSGISIDEIVRISKISEAWDRLIEVDDSATKKRIVISLE